MRMPEEILAPEPASMKESEPHATVRDMVYLAGKILQSAEKHNDTMTKMETTMARYDERLKVLEKIIWPVVLTALTGVIGAVFALITKH